MRTENAFAQIENLFLNREEFFQWLINLPHVRKEYIESKKVQTIEYKINSFRLATKINQFGRNNKRLRSENVVYKEDCKDALAAGLLPVFNFV